MERVVMKQLAVITGASSGIGRSLAFACAKGGFDLHLVARNKSELNVVKKELNELYETEVTIQALDLSKANSADKVFAAVSKQDKDVEIVINNAGVGDYSDVVDADWNKLDTMIQLNITTLTRLTQLFLPHMVGDHSGHIMNVASVAAFLPGPGMAVYHATKAYVLSFSDALAEELSGHNIQVTSLCPGPTASNFQKEASVEDLKVMNKNLPTADDVAKYGYEAMMQGKRIAVPGFTNRVNTWLPRFLPRAVVAKIIDRAYSK